MTSAEQPAQQPAERHADDATRAWLLGFAAGEAQPDQVEAWVDRVAGAVLLGVPELDRHDDLAELVRATVREQWVAFLAGIAEPPAEHALVGTAVDLAAALARRRLDLPVLLAAYRAAQREAWAYAIGVTRQAPADIDRAGVLVELWSRAGDWLDHATSASILVHQDEARRIARSGTAQRFELVRSLLAGAEPDARELGLALAGYPITGRHTALVLRAAGAEAMSRLEPTAHALVDRNPGRALHVEPGGRELWLWLSGDAQPPTSTDIAVPDGLLVAVGSPAEGIDGFRLSHEEALAAMRLALAQPAPGAVTHYERVAPLTFLAAEPAAARRFVRRSLAALADDVPGRDRLRETVLVVLGSAGVDEAAQRLGVHKNTVRYRVGQAEELLGHPLSERRGDVELALRYLEAFPDASDAPRPQPSP